MPARRPLLPILLLVASSPTLARAAGPDEKKACVDAYVAAQSSRSDHHLLAARTQLRTCARQECAPFMRGEMTRDCAQWLTEVEAGIPTVVFSAKDAAGNDIVDVTVSAEGTVLTQRLDGRAIEIDPGSHTFTFADAAGHTATQTAVALEGTKNQVVRVTFGQTAPPPPAQPQPPLQQPTPQPQPQPASAPTSTTTANPAAAEAPAAPTRSYWTGQRIIGVVATGVGLVGVGVGGLLGLSAKSQWNKANGESMPAAHNDSQSAYDLGNVASVVTIAGGVIAAAGLVVWLIAPSPQTQVGLDGHGLTLRGSF